MRHQPNSGAETGGGERKVGRKALRMGQTNVGTTPFGDNQSLLQIENVKIRPCSGRFRSLPKSITERRAREPRVQHADGDQSECRLATVGTGSATH